MSGGFDNKKDTGLELTAEELLLVQTAEDGVFLMRETTAPSATSGFGKLYVKSSDSKLYFKDDGGNEFDLTTSSGGTWGSITGTLSNQTDLQNALNAKQATLVSGTNIKSINGSSILTSGDLTLLTSLSGALLATGATTGATSQAQAFTNGVITGKLYPSADSTTAFQILKADGTTSVLNVDTTNGRVGIGTTSPAAKLDILSTTEQLRLSYDATHVTSITVDASGYPTFTAQGGNAALYFSSTTGNAVYLKGEANTDLNLFGGKGNGNEPGKISLTRSAAGGGVAIDSGGTNGIAFKIVGSTAMTIDSSSKVGIGLTAPTSRLHLAAGSATAGTAPLGFTSGTLLATAVAGKMEFLTDDYYLTITTGAARKKIALLPTDAVFTLAAAKTLTVSNTLTLTATDGSTLAIGTGGTLGTAAYTAATAYAAASHASAHAVGGADAVFPADPGADKFLKFNNTSNLIEWADVGAGSGASTALDNLASVAINAALVLGTSDAFALGSTTKMWADLFLADGAVINFNNGDVTLTHSLNTLTLGGGNLALGANNLTMTGSLGATGAGKLTKIWSVDAEFTNVPTINGGTLVAAIKATGTDVDTGTSDALFLTPKSVNDSHNIPMVAPGTSGNVMTSNGTDWTSAAPTGVVMDTTSGIGNLPASTSTQTITHGLGRTPKIIRITTYGSLYAGNQVIASMSQGTYNSTGNRCIYKPEGVNDPSSSTSYAAYAQIGSFEYVGTGIIQSVGATTFEIAWTIANSACSAGIYIWEAE